MNPSKNKFNIVINIVQYIVAIGAFFFALACVGKTSSSKEIPIIFLAFKFLLGNNAENWFNIFIHNYAIAFIAYIFSCLTFGISGIFTLYSMFFVIGFSFSYANGWLYYLFIFLESAGFLYAVISSTNLRFKIKSKGPAVCRSIISQNLIIICSILMLSSFVEILAIS